jgi:hypothetical protein
MRDCIALEQSREFVTARILVFVGVFCGLLTVGLMSLPT